MLIYLVLQFRMRVESFLLEIMLIVLILHTVLNYHHFNLLQLQVFTTNDDVHLNKGGTIFVSQATLLLTCGLAYQQNMSNAYSHILIVKLQIHYNNKLDQVCSQLAMQFQFDENYKGFKYLFFRIIGRFALIFGFVKILLYLICTLLVLPIMFMI